jgi:hypothetical protein
MFASDGLAAVSLFLLSARPGIVPWPFFLLLFPLALKALPACPIKPYINAIENSRFLLKLMNPPVFDAFELTALIESTEPSKNHRKLIKALQTRYPGQVFKAAAIQGDIYRAGGIVTRTGDRFADSTKAWLTAEFEKADQNARQVWQGWKDKDLLLTEHRLERIYIAIQYGQSPADFFQIELYQIQEMADHELFCQNPLWMPSSFRDLYDGYQVSPAVRGNQVENVPISVPRYEYKRVTDIADFVRQAQALDTQKRIARIPVLQKKTITIIETGPGAGPARQEPFFDHVPDYLRHKIPLTRLMEDWAESSAGQSGQLFSDHWSLQLSNYEYNGEPNMSAVPVWVTQKRLSEIRYKSRMSPYDLMAKVEKLDDKVGCPFAWFFYALHGNRLTSHEGEVIYRAVKKGLINLPEHDFAVLERWHEEPYAF